MGIRLTRSANVAAAGEILKRVIFLSADDKGASGLAEDRVAAVGTDQPLRLRLGRTGMTKLNDDKLLTTVSVTATLYAHKGSS